MIPLLEKFPKAQIHRGPLENNAALGLTPKPSRETGQSKGFGIRKVCTQKYYTYCGMGKHLNCGSLGFFNIHLSLMLPKVPFNTWYKLHSFLCLFLFCFLF